MRPSVKANRTSSSKRACAITKPTQTPTPKVGQDPIASTSEKNTRTRLPISHGSIFRWRPSQSLGFQVAAVTAKSASDYKTGDTSSISTGSSITDFSISTYSTLPSDWTTSENSPSTAHGNHSTLFVISKIDPWGPMAIFAPQLKVGMRIVAINHQPCPKTQQGLQALLESSHSPTNPEAPPQRMKHPATYGEGNSKSSKDESSTGWITLHAVDLKEELKQRQFYLSQIERGLEPDEERSEQSSEARPLEEIREDDEGINIIQVEIVTSELKRPKQKSEKGETDKDEPDSELTKQLKALHFLEEQRQCALFREAQEKKKGKQENRKERRRQKHDRYMDKNIWNMKIKSEPDTESVNSIAALENFSLLPAAASKKPEPRKARTPSKEEMEAMEKLHEVRELSEIHKKVQSIEKDKKENAVEKKEDQGKKDPVEEKEEIASDWNPFASIQKMLLSSTPPPPPPASPASPLSPPPPPPPQAKSKPTMSQPMTSNRSMASTISTKLNSQDQGGWFSGWGNNIIENAPTTLEPKVSISPQKWYLPVIEKETATWSLNKTGKETTQKSNTATKETSSKKDPDGARAAASEDDNVPAPVDCPTKQPKVMQLQKLGKRGMRPKSDDPDTPAKVQCPTNQPKEMQLQKVGKWDNRARWSPQFASYNDSMRSSKQTTGTKEKTNSATVGQLRQLVVHLEKTEHAQNTMPLQHMQPVSKTASLKHRAMPFPEQARRRKPAEQNMQQAQQSNGSQMNRSIPSHISDTPSSEASSVSALADAQAYQGLIPQTSLLMKEYKSKRKEQKKAIAAAAAINTTTAFTLPVSRSSKSSDEKKKQLKKLQATWKAARQRNAREAKAAAKATSKASARQTTGKTTARQENGPQDWDISSLFMSFFHCGETYDDTSLYL
ncbi:unnamed protein product [Cylindrotheca closterium]|uniref:Uncharacterized protein n=1 Tax=Cylindrotheca closterium TaxID=2856 RepID=A0AAD2CT22_9STRA|nr:unnamed protein product [Cylindrotheca closterium]